MAELFTIFLNVIMPVFGIVVLGALVGMCKSGDTILIY